MIQTPLVSVVLCTYNDEKYIRETIDSVLSQSYHNFEFIIWNDGSTDSTEQIIKSYKDNRIRYFYHENTGVGEARFFALQQVRGKYVAIIDGDDICFKERIEREVSFLEKHMDYVLVSSQVVFIDDANKELGLSFNCTISCIIKKMLQKDSVIFNPSVMFRKNIYDMTGGYMAINLGEDHLVFCRMGEYGKVKILKDYLIKYRVRANSLMHCFAKSHYLPILSAYRRKMADDAVVSPLDVAVYNELYKLMKEDIIRYGNEDNPNNQEYKKRIEQQVYDCIKPLFGRIIARDFVICLKNSVFIFKCLIDS